MNVLLLSMPDVGPGYSPDILTAPSLALSSLAGNMDRRHHVKIADLVLRRKNVKEAVREALAAVKPDLVGLSAMTFQFDSAVRIAKYIKSVSPGIQVALGGYHVTLMYCEIAESPDSEYFDLLFRGESELSFNEALNRIEHAQPLSGLDGLSFKENGRFIHNRRRSLEDLGRIKLPNRSVRLWNDYNTLAVPFDLVEFSRGCLMSCSFCCIRGMYGRSFRTFGIQRVLEDIHNAKKRGTRILFFCDDNITTDVDQFGHLCEEIINHGHNDIHYAVQASSVGIASSKSLVQKMAKAGFKMVFLGMESASNENLKYLKKGDIIEKTKLAVKYLKESDILVAIGLIIGLPPDDRKSIERTIAFTRDMEADFASVQLLVPYPKTEIRKQLLKGNLIANLDDFRSYNSSFATVRTNRLTPGQLSLAAYKYEKKYFKSKKITILRSFRKDIGLAFRFLGGGLRLLPSFLQFLFHENLKKLFMSERQIFENYLLRESRLNKFNL